MALFNLPNRKAASGSPPTDCLSMYEQYGSMAYGVILHIIPQPELAQDVLIELFTSAEIRNGLDPARSESGQIIRLARSKAIARRHNMPGAAYVQPDTKNLPELAFDLCFRQGHSPDRIAEQLQLTRNEVFMAIRTFFSYLRTS